MRLFRRILRTGAAVGTAFAATKVAEKYRENNPDGVGDVNGDGKVDYQDKLEEIKKAATEVGAEGIAYLKEKAPGVEQRAAEAGEKAGEFFDNAGEKAEDLFHRAAEKADEFFGKGKEKL